MLGGVWTAQLWLIALTTFPAAREYRDAALFGLDSFALWTAYDTLVLLQLPVLIAVYVVVSIWLMHARENSEAMSPRQPTRARGWIWAGWLVPVVALWFPFQVVRDIVRAGGRRGGPALGWWWALWIAGNAVSQGAGRLIPLDGSPVAPELIGALGPVETVAALLLTGAFALWCVLALRITREQQAAVSSVQVSAAPPLR